MSAFDSSDEAMEGAARLIEQHGFAQTGDRRDDAFGDRWITLRRGALRLRIDRDRGSLAVSIWDGRDWLDLTLWQACLDDAAPATELGPIGEQVGRIIERLNDLTAFAAQPASEVQDCLRRKAALRFESKFPGWTRPRDIQQP